MRKRVEGLVMRLPRAVGQHRLRRMHWLLPQQQRALGPAGLPGIARQRSGLQKQQQREPDRPAEMLDLPQ